MTVEELEREVARLETAICEKRAERDVIQCRIDVGVPALLRGLRGMVDTLGCEIADARVALGKAKQDLTMARGQVANEK